jgi:hypothetical protein
MVKVRSVRTTSSRIVVELEKTKRVTKFKPSAKERKLVKFAKEAIDQLGKSYDELETEREKYDNQIKKLKEEVNEWRTDWGRLDIENLELKRQIAGASLTRDTPGCFTKKISKVKLHAVENLLQKVGAGPSLVRTSKGVYGCVTNSPDIMAKQSKTIAAGIVHYSTEPKMTRKEKQEFCKVSGVSALSINKMTHLIQEHLSSSIHR